MITTRSTHYFIELKTDQQEETLFYLDQESLIDMVETLKDVISDIESHIEAGNGK